MITSLPAVQVINLRSARRYNWYVSARWVTSSKRIANRRYRRHLAAATRRMQLDPELFYDEPFSAPSLSTWELW